MRNDKSNDKLSFYQIILTKLRLLKSVFIQETHSLTDVEDNGTAIFKSNCFF